MKGNKSQESELELQTLIYQRGLTCLCSPETLKDIMPMLAGTEEEKGYFKQWAPLQSENTSNLIRKLNKILNCFAQ